MQLFEQAPTSDELVAFIDTQHQPVKVSQICKHFGIKASKAKGSAYSQLRTLLRELVAAGEVAKRQARPRANHFYHSIPRLLEAVEREQEGPVVRFKVGLQPSGPAISLDDLKAKARKSNVLRRKLRHERDLLEQQIEQETARLDVLLSLIDPFDENFRTLGDYRHE